MYLHPLNRLEAPGDEHTLRICRSPSHYAVGSQTSLHTRAHVYACDSETVLPRFVTRLGAFRGSV
jgi:hypothetical protein